MTTKPKEWIIICSPVSGKKKGKEVVENILLPIWNKINKDIPIKVIYTEYYQHAIEISKEYGSKECGIICVGGDGTIHEVLSGLLLKGVLAETPIGILSQGTMNFYSVTAGLPDASKLPEIISTSTRFRSSSLIKVTDDSGKINSVSFEAFHLGTMASRVCFGAQEWRFLPGGVMFGIILNLLGCNALPNIFHEEGELQLFLKDSPTPITLKGEFFWIIATHRNPYNGCVGNDLWVSIMSMENLPSFGRRMAFFEPPMEHFCGTSNVFEAHYKCRKMIFTNSARNKTGIVMDGDGFYASRVITVEDMPHAWQVVADKQFLDRLPDKYYKKMEITDSAKSWRRMNPPSKDIFDVTRDFIPTEEKEKQSSSNKSSTLLPIISFIAIALILYRRYKQNN